MDIPNQLETKRCILKPFERDDFEVFSNLLKDDIVSENLEFLVMKKIEEKPEFLFESIINSSKTLNTIVALIILNKNTGNTIGSCGLFLLEDSNEAMCFYSLFPSYRGYGFAIEAVKKLIEYAFMKLKLFKLITLINPKNSKAWKVAERVGMKYMGQVQINDLSSIAMYFSIEKIEFEAQLLI